jgi:hypothetical protein
VVPVRNDPYEGKFNKGDQCEKDSKYSSDNRKFITGSKTLKGCDALRKAVAQ